VRIDQIILLVCADESDVNNAVLVVNLGDQPVLVARYVEHHAAILQHACRTELSFYVGGRAPNGMEYVAMPRQQGRLRI
jgi:hypothetical protein